jgi:hypothetical protein
VTALARLERLRLILGVTTLVQALLWSAAAVAFVLAGGVLLRVSPASVALAAEIAGLVVLGVMLWRNRAVRSPYQVALWLEWRVPQLRYSLVTLAEGHAGDAPALERSVAEIRWAGPVRGALLRRLGLPALLLLIAFAVLRLVPSMDSTGIEGARTETGADDRFPRGSDPFRSFTVTVTPPGYSRLSRQTLRQPEAVTSLAGSSIRVDGSGWSVSTVMPETARPFWLERGGRRRLLLLIPAPDSSPSVQLVTPARDSVLRTPGGALSLGSTVHDDFGLSAGWFEYIVSSGEGENYTFRTGVIGRRRFNDDPQGELESRIILDSLRLAPGNIVHLRAVAQDRNSVSGPGVGYSETRTLRIPRPGEGDSVSVDQVARAEGDSSLLSQRMLVMLAEALERRRPALRRDTFVAESRRIAGDQATLRRRVADIIFLRLGAEGSMEESEDSTAEPLTPDALLEAAERATVTSEGQTLDFSSDETPVVALNRPLLEAYNAMWAAGRELEIGEPRRALPHMREAVEAIQRARQAERIYLRGRPATSVIDLAKVRLAGSITDAAPRRIDTPDRDLRVREALLVRYSRAITLLPDPGAIDSLQLLRIDALESEPGFAAAVGAAVTALREGRDATTPLIQARRILAGPLRETGGLHPWDVTP